MTTSKVKMAKSQNILLNDETQRKSMILLSSSSCRTLNEKIDVTPFDKDISENDISIELGPPQGSSEMKNTSSISHISKFSDVKNMLRSAFTKKSPSPMDFKSKTTAKQTPLSNRSSTTNIDAGFNEALNNSKI